MSYVYKFIDYRDKIIYIGKTNNIEYRIKQHFSKNGHLPKKCYEYVKEIWFIEVNGKTNVDIYETFLINKYVPRYNVEKKFQEMIDLHKNDFISLEEIDWKQLYFQFNESGIMCSKKPIEYPFFNNNLMTYDKAIVLLDYNYYQLINRKGLYEYYIDNILEEQENFLEYLILLHQNIINNKKFNFYLSNFDKPLSNENDAFEYVAINIKDINCIDLEKLLVMVQCKMLIRLSKNVYGLVVHTPYTLKQFSQHYYFNENELIPNG